MQRRQQQQRRQRVLSPASLLPPESILMMAAGSDRTRAPQADSSSSGLRQPPSVAHAAFAGSLRTQARRHTHAGQRQQLGGDVGGGRQAQSEPGDAQAAGAQHGRAGSTALVRVADAADDSSDETLSLLLLPSCQ
jgi:hypothetical protein